MKALKITALIAGAVFFLALAGGIVLGVAGAGDGLRGLIDDIRSAETGLYHTVSDDRTATLEGIDRIRVEAGDADIVIRRSERGDAGIHLTTDGADPEDTLRISSEDGALRLKVQSPRRWWFFGFLRRRITAELTLPSNWRGALTVAAGAGELRLEGEHAFTRLDLDVAAADARLDTVTADAVGVNIGAGRLTADSLSAGSLKLEVGAGEARLGGLTGSVEASIGAGDAALTFDRLSAAVTVDVSMGSATLRLPADTGASLLLKASLGSVKQRFGDRFSGTEKEGRVDGILNEPGPSIRGDVHMGDLKVEPRS